MKISKWILAVVLACSLPGNVFADILILKDGRSFELSGSNDVDRGNRGIIIRTDGREYEVDWNDFAEATFSH